MSNIPTEEKTVTKNVLRRTMWDAYGNWYWQKRWGQPKAERVRHVLEYRRLRGLLNAGAYIDEANERGNVIHRDVDADAVLGFRGGSRYAYDGRLQGWRQFDTSNDASYFGVWVNLESRSIMTYCEGDRTLVVCPTDESLKAELDSMEAFYGPTPASMMSIDTDGSVTHYIDPRPTVTLAA